MLLALNPTVAIPPTVPHQHTTYYVGEFFLSSQTSAVRGRTKTRLLVKHGFPVTDSIHIFHGLRKLSVRPSKLTLEAVHQQGVFPLELVDLGPAL